MGVQQAGWYKEGYECEPLQKDDHYNVLWSYDKCRQKIVSPNPSNINITQNNQFNCRGSEVSADNCYEYYPFVGLQKLPYYSVKNSNLRDKCNPRPSVPNDRTYQSPGFI